MEFLLLGIFIGIGILQGIIKYFPKKDKIDPLRYNPPSAVHMRREIREAEHEIRLQAMAIVSESFYVKASPNEVEKYATHQQGTDILAKLALLTPEQRS